MREVEFEMGADVAEFLRLLPAALGGLPFSRDGDRIAARDGGRTVDIDLAPEESRRLAALSLPVTRVRLRLHGFEDDEAELFLARFRLAYQRGGG
jgi:hypothetical protein